MKETWVPISGLVLGCAKKLGSTVRISGLYPEYTPHLNVGYNPLIRSPLIPTSVPGHPKYNQAQWYRGPAFVVEMLSFGTSEGVGLGWKEGGLGGGFIFLNVFIPNLGEMIQFDEHIYFERGWFNHQQEWKVFLSGWPEE